MLVSERDHKRKIAFIVVVKTVAILSNQLLNN